VENGITNKLDGSDDEFLSSMIRSIWFEIKMPEEREKIMADILEGHEQGDFKSMDDYYERLHEDYDDHAPLEEGKEGAVVIVEGINEDLEMDVNLKSDDEGWKDTLVDICPQEVDEDPPPLPPPKELKTDEVFTMDEAFNMDDARLNAIRESIALNVAAGNTQVVQILEASLASEIKSKHKMKPEAAKCLRIEREKRAAELKSQRAAAVLTDQWDDQYKKVTVLMQKDATNQLALAKCQNATLRLQQQGFKNDAKKARFAQLLLDEANERYARFYACALSRHLKKAMAGGAKANVEAAVKLLINQKKLPEAIVDLVPYWHPVKNTSQLISVQAGWGKVSPKIFASKFLSEVMFGIKAPEKYTALTGADQQFYRICSECCPFIRIMYGAERNLPLDCLRIFKFDCDLAFVHCVMAYSRAVGHVCFPQGLFKFPPADTTWMIAVPELKLTPTFAAVALVEEMEELPLAASSSSSGSGAAGVSFA
jgi:hypothetical protein